MENQPLREGIDFSYNDKGQMVLSREFLLRRGYCCQSGCLNCPYEEGLKLDPSQPLELREVEEDPYEKYIEMAEREDL